MARALSCLALVLVGWCAVLAAAEPKSSARSTLNSAQLNILNEEVIPAHRQQNSAELLSALAPLVARINEAQLAAVDAHLADRQIPSVSELLAAARLALAEQNLQTESPPPKPRELALTVRGLKARLNEVLALYRTEEAFDDGAPLPVNLAEFEYRFWDMHVLENRLANALRMARYAQTLVEDAPRLNTKSLSDEDRLVLETDFPFIAVNLESMNRELAERTMELRVRRLEYAASAVGSSASLKERFQAAFVVDLDGELLTTFIQQSQKRTLPDAAPEGVVFRKLLADPQLATRIAKLRDEGRKAAGEDLLTKSRLLFTGLHWWYRGRYGRGSEGNGLLKSKLSLVSPEAMFGLYMPRKTPEPTDPTSGSQQVPEVDRRHHYLWQFETRQITTSQDSDTKTSRTSHAIGGSQITTFDRFY